MLHGIFHFGLTADKQSYCNITKCSAVETTEYGHKQNHISEMNLVQYFR